MLEHVSETFTDQDVRLDGRAFVDCRFVGCRLRFSGQQPTRLVRGEFVRCEWIFEAAALNTLMYLQVLYHDAGPGGGELVGDIIDKLMAHAISADVGSQAGAARTDDVVPAAGGPHRMPRLRSLLSRAGGADVGGGRATADVSDEGRPHDRPTSDA